eukprot:TRINITY_DN30406_c0_g3_i2.p1 TRINITY_DN30406_c0_g3~~TRINITY_DN30406_c0_g3_i2.p1  ORF type:complete len:250 (-),score=65.09 TRINITY_DN30406_c0_g3_i2:628-1377(-)
MPTWHLLRLWFTVALLPVMARRSEKRRIMQEEAREEEALELDLEACACEEDASCQSRQVNLTQEQIEKEEAWLKWDSESRASMEGWLVDRERKLDLDMRLWVQTRNRRLESLDEFQSGTSAYFEILDKLIAVLHDRATLSKDEREYKEDIDEIENGVLEEIGFFKMDEQARRKITDLQAEIEISRRMYETSRAAFQNGAKETLEDGGGEKGDPAEGGSTTTEAPAEEVEMEAKPHQEMSFSTGDQAVAT